jgi:hypothetical protein
MPILKTNMAEQPPQLNSSLVESSLQRAAAQKPGTEQRNAFEQQALKTLNPLERAQLEVFKKGMDVAHLFLQLRETSDMLRKLPIFTGKRYERSLALTVDIEATAKAERGFMDAIDAKAKQRLAERAKNPGGEVGLQAAIDTVNRLNPPNQELEVVNAKGEKVKQKWRGSEVAGMAEGAMVVEAQAVTVANGVVEFGGGLKTAIADIQQAIDPKSDAPHPIVRHKLFYAAGTGPDSRPDVAMPIKGPDGKVTYVVLKGKQVEDLYKHTEWADKEEKRRRYGEPPTNHAEAGDDPQVQAVAKRAIEAVAKTKTDQAALEAINGAWDEFVVASPELAQKYKEYAPIAQALMRQAEKAKVAEPAAEVPQEDRAIEAASKQILDAIAALAPDKRDKPTMAGIENQVWDDFIKKYPQLAEANKFKIDGIREALARQALAAAQPPEAAAPEAAPTETVATPVMAGRS